MADCIRIYLTIRLRPTVFRIPIESFPKNDNVPFIILLTSCGYIGGLRRTYAYAYCTELYSFTFSCRRYVMQPAHEYASSISIPNPLSIYTCARRIPVILINYTRKKIRSFLIIRISSCACGSYATVYASIRTMMCVPTEDEFLDQFIHTERNQRIAKLVTAVCAHTLIHSLRRGANKLRAYT